MYMCLQRNPHAQNKNLTRKEALHVIKP
uniref:Uncharacterized protein n=1 Tax=Rhizophora mucronata TaxID=61149 RepID=A0A2P2K0X2_RHIMU